MHAEGFDAIAGGFLAVVNIIGEHDNWHGRCPAHVPGSGHPDCPVIAVVWALTDVRLYVCLPAGRRLEMLQPLSSLSESSIKGTKPRQQSLAGGPYCLLPV